MKKEFKKIVVLLLSFAIVLTFAACGGGGDTSKEDTGTLNVCLASEPANLDPALNSAVDGATMILHLFSGLSKFEKGDDGNLKIVPDCAVELPEPVDNGDGTFTYTYTLKDGLKWSDGEPVKAGDFVFAWNRAASPNTGADYGYMFEVVKGYDVVSEVKETGEVDEEGEPIYEAANPDAKLDIEAPDDKTIVVTLTSNISYWNELLTFPTYMPVREDVVANDGWQTDPATFVGNGPYKMTGWEHNSVINLEKNPEWYAADTVTMDKINCYLSDDANNMYANFQTGEWHLIDDVPTNEMAAAKEAYPDEYKVDGQIGTYYVCWNINEEILPEGSTLQGKAAEEAKSEIRRAIGLLFDRNHIVENIAQGGQVPAPSFVAMGMTEPDGSEFYKNSGTSDSYDGYYDVSAEAIQSNYDSAMEVLKKYYTFDEASGQFTDFPTLNYLYNTSDAHQAIGEYLQSALATIGITMNLENQEWATFLDTRKNGDYSIARNGWVADYNDPICFLDMWTTASGNNDVQFGKGANKKVKAYSLDITDLGYELNVKDGTWAETYDKLISLIKTCSDNTVRYQLMHRAEDMLMQTGCICPIYYYTDTYIISKNVSGFYSNPLGYKYFMYTTIG